MAIRVSELSTIGLITDSDYLIVNDGNVKTSKISFKDFTGGLVRKDDNSVIEGDLTLTGTLRPHDIVFDQDLIYLDREQARVGILNDAPMHELDVNGNIHIRNGNTLRLGDETNQTAVTFQAKRNTVNSEYALPLDTPAVDGMVLACNTAGDMHWDAALKDPMSDPGDMLYKDAASATTVLPVGEPGQLLTVGPNRLPQWRNQSLLAGGLNSQVQINLDGALRGTNDLTYNPSDRTVYIHNLEVTNELTFGGTNLVTYRVIPPGSQFAPGTRGQISVDDSYFYVCREDNIWVRTALASW